MTTEHIPGTFVLHVRTTLCKRCHVAHTTSELYVVADIRPGYRHLVRATEPPTFRPELVTLPIERIDACHECVSALPIDPVPPRDWHAPFGWRNREREAVVLRASTRPDSDDLA